MGNQPKASHAMHFISHHSLLGHLEVSDHQGLSRLTNMMQGYLQQTLHLFFPVVLVLKIVAYVVGVKSQGNVLLPHLYPKQGRAVGHTDDISLWISKGSPSVVPCWCWKVEEIQPKLVDFLEIELKLALVPFLFVCVCVTRELKSQMQRVFAHCRCNQWVWYPCDILAY